MANRFNDPVEQALNDAGVSLPAAQLFFFETLTSTPLDTFSDEALTIANTNPVIANSAGRFGDIFLQAKDYKVQLKTSVTTSSSDIWERDPVNSGNAAGLIYDPPFASSVSRSVQSRLGEVIYAKDFGAVGDDNGATDSTTAITNAITAATNAGPLGAIVELGFGKFKITSQITVPNRVRLRGQGHTVSGSAATSDAPTIILKSGTFDGIKLTGGAAALQDLQVLGDVGNTGDNIVIVSARAHVSNVASTNAGNDNWRYGDSSGTSCNFCESYNCIGRDAGRFDLYVHDGGGGLPNANNCNFYGFKGRGATSDGIRVDNAIDTQFFGVRVTDATGFGLNAVSGANGTKVIGHYMEANTAGDGQISSGALNCFVAFPRVGASPWTIGDTSAYVLENSTGSAFLTQLLRVAGFIMNGPSSQDYGIDASDTGTDALRIFGKSAATNFILQMFSNDGDGTDSVLVEMYAEGTESDTTNRSRLVLDYNAGTGEYELKSNASGSGTLRNIRIEVGGTGSNEILFKQNDVQLIMPQGIGDAANANLQAPAKGTGGGPTNLVADTWIRIQRADGTRGFIPFFLE